MTNERYGNRTTRFDSMFPGVEFTTESGTDAVGEGAYRTRDSYDPLV